MPKNAIAKAAVGLVYNFVGRTIKPLKTLIALREFWIGLQAWCTRNVAEIDGLAAGTGGTTAAKPATAVKRPHRKTAGATA